MLEEVEFQNPWVAYETTNNGRTANKNDEKLWNDIACLRCKMNLSFWKKKKKKQCRE
jgi:hypothetical protein